MSQDVKTHVEREMYANRVASIKELSSVGVSAAGILSDVEILRKRKERKDLKAHFEEILDPEALRLSPQNRVLETMIRDEQYLSELDQLLESDFPDEPQHSLFIHLLNNRSLVMAMLDPGSARQVAQYQHSQLPISPQAFESCLQMLKKQRVEASAPQSDTELIELNQRIRDKRGMV
jgi:hypothetical protein